MTELKPQICLTLLKILPTRTREVVERRFGLRVGEPETLESIGQDFGITRERVRQIEFDGLKRLASFASEKEGRALTQKLYKDWVLRLKSHGDLKKEDDFLSEIGGSKFRQHAFLLLTLGEPFERLGETDDFHSVWTLNRDSLNSASQVIDAFSKKLKELGRTLEEKEVLLLYRKEIQPEVALNIKPQAIFSYLAVSKKIGKGLHGFWGLQEWPEVAPRGLRDRAYLVYKKEKKPLHFTEVARLIDYHGFGAEGRKVLHQSVHNDLIRDSRFVLIGRGMYALSEWGYEPGVVREVIANVIKRANLPLTAKEIVREVTKQRQVKETTVLINLQNKNYFIKTAEDKYTLVPQGKTSLA